MPILQANKIVGLQCKVISFVQGFPGGSDGKESVCNAGDHGSIPWTEPSGGLQSMGSQRVEHD